ncbi:HNH endonuclease [Mycolicibacterium farcinogenes]|nr:HNH endonuclease [Mycolicibacterium farcinogenes]
MLEQEYGPSHGKSLREWAMGRLKMDGELNDHVDQYVRLRIALSLCPTSALVHRKSERTSRAEKIRDHMVRHQLVDVEDAERLASIVDEVVDNWLTARINVAGFKAALVDRDGSLCNACHVDLDQPATAAISVARQDPYKLTWVHPEKAIYATVDHKVPVSKFGTNDMANLELLCRYCNEGKDDGSPLLLKHEVELAAVLPCESLATAQGLVSKSAHLVYRVLKRDSFSCSACGDSNSELTVRKNCADGLAVMSNLSSICYGCLDVEANGSDQV